jgi:hypothetical protein
VPDLDLLRDDLDVCGGIVNEDSSVAEGIAFPLEDVVVGINEACPISCKAEYTASWAFALNGSRRQWLRDNMRLRLRGTWPRSQRRNFGVATVRLEVEAPLLKGDADVLRIVHRPSWAILGATAMVSARAGFPCSISAKAASISALNECS